MFRVLAFLSAVILCSSLFAQDNSYQFSHLNISNGLSDNQVNAIHKDQKGFMWFGTLAGLNRYDGHEFKIFKHNSRDSTSIPDDYIFEIIDGPQKSLWIRTTKGFISYNYQTEKFERLGALHLSKYHVPEEGLREIKTDGKGKYYFQIDNQGIFCYDSRHNSTIKYAHKDGVSTSLYSNSISDFVDDQKGNLWVIHRNGLLEKYNLRERKVTNRYWEVSKRFAAQESYFALRNDSEGNVFIFGLTNPFGLYYLHVASNKFHYFGKQEDHSGLSSNNVGQIVEASDGTIWIGTDHGGINILDKRTNKISYILSKEGDLRGLTENSISALYKDNNGVIWIGTFKKGVCYYHKSIFKFPRDQYLTGKNAVYKDVNSFAEDKKGNLWIGTNGTGLLYLNRSTGEIKTYRNNPANNNSLSSDIVVSLCIDHAGILWIGTYLGGLDSFDGTTFTHYKHSSNPSSISDNRIYALLEDSFNRLWVGTLNGGLELLDQTKGTFKHFNTANTKNLNSDVIAGLYQDKKKDIWIVTGSGISVLNPRTLSFRSCPDDIRNSIRQVNVNSIVEDARGWFWIGTNEGVSIYNPITRKFNNLNEEIGMPENVAFELQEDENHNIWYSSRNGLYKITVVQEGKAYTFSYSKFDESDGLAGRQFNKNAAYKTTAGELIFGGSNGFNIFKPQQIRNNKYPSTLVMSELEIFNHNVRVGESINGHVILPETITELKQLVLKYKENVFSLKFALLNYFNGGKVTYKYNLEGFDKRWLSASSDIRKATFTNLDPGEYILHVKAFEGNNAEPIAVSQLKIIIQPPFWRTTWAYILYILAIGCLLLFIRSRGIRKLKQEFALEQERIHVRQLREQDRKEAERLRELDLLKIKFLTNLSHEFRTPISLILAPVDKLLAETKEKERYGQLAMVKRNARRLLNLVNQLLDFRKMEEQELQLNKSEGEIVSFIKDATESFYDLAERKQIKLSFKSFFEKSNVSFDHDKVERIVFNLLSNAFKFTPAGGSVGVELEMLEQRPREGSVTLELKVLDSGIGIPKDKQERIFERFFQNETSSSILNQGSGIGLSITKEFVKMHDGDIMVESEPGAGSCFIVRLKLTSLAFAEPKNTEIAEVIVPEVTEDEQIDKSELSDAKVRGRNAPVVLLVEDNEDFRFYLKDNLKYYYKIIEASNGKEGWQKALALHPHLIVSDISMPEMNGTELCEKLKSDKRTKHIPVILLTALAGEEDQLKGLETGANDYMTKPFNFEILHSKIKNLLTLHQTFKKTYTKQINIQTPEIEIESDDVKFLNSALRYIEDNLHNPQLSVEDLSRHMAMSRVSLYKRCLKVTGKTPVDYIRSVKLEKAAVLLEKSDKTISEICYMVGFSTPNYFAKSFKAKYDMLPSEYQAEKRKLDRSKTV